MTSKERRMVLIAFVVVTVCVAIVAYTAGTMNSQFYNKPQAPTNVATVCPPCPPVVCPSCPDECIYNDAKGQKEYRNGGVKKYGEVDIRWGKK